MSDPRTQLVADGYDVIADRYLDWRDEIHGDPRQRYLDEATARLSDGARVLELGCGAGIPDTKVLASRFRVTGVDISSEQVARARENVPEAAFLRADLTALQLEDTAFDAVIAIYCLNHVPRELLAPLFERVHSWLAPGGILLASLGSGDEEEWTGDWLGTTMYFSSFDARTNRRLLVDAGFELELDELTTMREPEPHGLAEVTFHWVLCRR